MAYEYKTKPIPTTVGVGLRYPHYKQVIEERPDIAWFEVHSENFFAEGGVNLYILEKIRENYPLSFHGVGLSLGSAEGINTNHLKKLKKLVDNFKPGLVSDHVSWSSVSPAGNVINDLLPLAWTKESAVIMADNIKYVQDYLGRQILIENPSSYLQFKESTMPEYEFVAKVAEEADCGILFDINNIFVAFNNHNIEPINYINAMPKTRVKEIHLAGHAIVEIDGKKILIDDHGSKICDKVWQLYEKAMAKFGGVPTLIEWDTNIPEFAVLVEEVKKAEQIMSLYMLAA